MQSGDRWGSSDRLVIYCCLCGERDKHIQLNHLLCVVDEATEAFLCFFEELKALVEKQVVDRVWIVIVGRFINKARQAFGNSLSFVTYQTENQESWR